MNAYVFVYLYIYPMYQIFTPLIFSTVSVGPLEAKAQKEVGVQEVQLGVVMGARGVNVCEGNGKRKQVVSWG